jgi:hypothetical protein
MAAKLEKNHDSFNVNFMPTWFIKHSNLTSFLYIDFPSISDENLPQLMKLRTGGFDLEELPHESLDNFKNFLRTQNNLGNLRLGYTFDTRTITGDYYQVILDLWKSETLVTVNSTFVDHLLNIPDDQLKNHRIKTLKMKESLPTNDIELMQRCFRLFPAITCLHLPYKNLMVDTVIESINDLNLNELVIYMDITSDLHNLNFIRIKNLEKFSLKKLEGRIQHSSALYYDSFKKFIENHPQIKEIEIHVTCCVDINVAGLIVKNLKDLEKLVIKTDLLTLRCSSKDIEYLRKIYGRN